MYIVELHEGCWLAPWTGDPGRTLVLKTAKLYLTKRGAKIALGLARRFRKFSYARVMPANDR